MTTGRHQNSCRFSPLPFQHLSDRSPSSEVANGVGMLAAATLGTCVFTNVERGMADVLKTVSGGPPNGEVFEFEIRKGADESNVGEVIAVASPSRRFRHSSATAPRGARIDTGT